MIFPLSYPERYQILGVPWGRQKVKEACHYTHLGNIQEMKSISKPRLPFEIYTFAEIMLADDFRKKFSKKHPSLF